MHRNSAMKKKTRGSSWIASLVATALATACGGSHRPPSPPVETQAKVEVRVTVEGVEWRPVKSFEGSGPDDRHYVISIDEDGSTTVAFGDGIRGRRPPTGATVGVSYRYGAGSQGNVWVSLERVVGSRAEIAACLSLRVNDRRLEFRPCDTKQAP